LSINGEEENLKDVFQPGVIGIRFMRAVFVLCDGQMRFFKVALHFSVANVISSVVVHTNRGIPTRNSRRGRFHPDEEI
jgi:hypothetical protein